MFELKPINAIAIPAALKKAERYRLLNEPREAESICRDVLAVQPDHMEARLGLVLSLTDQFGGRSGVTLAQTINELAAVPDEYERTYHAGLIYERWARAQLQKGVPGHSVFGWVREALGHYQRAEELAPPGDDEAVLRWNACVRLIQTTDGLVGIHAPDVPAGPIADLPLE